MKKTKHIILIIFILLYTISTNFSNVFAEESRVLENRVNFDIVSNNVAVLDIQTGLFIYGKNPEEKVFPASTTKLMTALLLIENTEDFDKERIHFTTEAVSNMEFGAVTIGMNNGDTLSVRDALYALLLASANEVANAIAINVSGSVEEFGKLMTKRAKELGATNTNFTNPSGLHDDDHYSTAKDMALIMAEISKYDIFTEIASTVSYDIAPTETYKNTRHVRNTNKLIKESSMYFNPLVQGSKTGYTSMAGFNLCTYSKNDDGVELVISTLNSTNDGRFIDTNNLIEYAYNSYSRQAITKYVDIVELVYIEELDSNVFLKLNVNDIYFNLPLGVEHANIKYVTKLKENIKPEILEDTNIGTVDFYIGDKYIGSDDLILKKSISILRDYSKYLHKSFYKSTSLDAKKYNSNFNVVLFVCVVVIFIGYFIKTNNGNKKRKRKRKRTNKRIYRSNKSHSSKQQMRRVENQRKPYQHKHNMNTNKRHNHNRKKPPVRNTNKRVPPTKAYINKYK